MDSRRHCLFVLVALSSMGASYRTTNFIVDAPTAQMAQQVGRAAEYYRQQKAVEWLGREMPAWLEPCPLKVDIRSGGAGGATTFAFDRGRILHQEMNVQGPLDRILASVLPHEVTHTVFAYYFRCPLPRWADEGGAVLSEDDIERRRHDDLIRSILAGTQPGCRGFRLRYLFEELKDYPRGNDVMTLYAQGYSITRFLVENTSRPDFLAFVAHGMRYGWDSAAQSHLGMRSLEEVEKAWLDWMRNTFQPNAFLLAKASRRRASDPALAARNGPSAHTAAQASAPPTMPVIRAQAPSDDEPRWPAGNRAAVRPDRDGWSPVNPLPDPPRNASGVRLLPPQPASQAERATEYPP